MKLPKNNRIFIALFFCGIIIPTAILAILSFRNVQNELLLTEKNFEDSQTAFLKQTVQTIQNEQREVLKESKNASQFLYEQPQKLLEFGNAASFKKVPGVSAIFLFNENHLVFPSVSITDDATQSSAPITVPGRIEKELLRGEISGRGPEKIEYARSAVLMRSPFISKQDNILNVLGLLRLHYKKKAYNEVLQIIDFLEQHPEFHGYLQNDLIESLHFLKFEIFVEEKKHEKAENYCLALFSDFLEGRSLQDIGKAKFFFDNALSQILSFEDLSQEKRDAFWNLRENLNRQLEHAEIFTQHREFLERFAQDQYSSKDGIFYKRDAQTLFFRMAYPWLSGDQVVIGMIDADAYRDRICKRLAEVSREWKHLIFTITDNRDSTISGKVPKSDAEISRQIDLGEGLGWSLTLYKRNSQEIYSEARHKMFLLSGLVAFSLLTVLLGSFFILKSISQERKLIMMKTNFLSSVSHELKTPLTSIKMFAEMISNGRVQKIEKCQEYTKLIVKESSRLENLIAAILNYTRMESGKQVFHWEKMDLSECVAKVYESILDQADNRGITMTKELNAGAFIMGDFTALYSLVQSLIENAIKYTNPPGKVHVKVAEENGKIVFSVADTGIGIASSEQKNIFNDFYRVGDEMTRSTKGSGLGLAIVKRVAEAHKASISVQSHPGKGSTFIVRLKKAE
ncbi:sensor histidine kinase [Hallerella porci]|uniref:histidine kinase n=1 Tax=Hallerella porci TaxID=1945871 RepID=A0ABX5LRV2_9BACT|nr:HAMP domain-containing sensor histidine kinase [Hallerella porci]PWL04013.1 phospho-acceptor domain-containing protein [Hallerella porci]